MSETWTSLLAALVGAIVGGAASLAGTMLVNRMQMATNARMRLYDQLLPELDLKVGGLYGLRAEGDPEFIRKWFEEATEMVRALERAGSIAGREERAAAHKIARRLVETERAVTAWLQTVHSSTSRLTREERAKAWSKVGKEMHANIRAVLDEIRAFSDHLGAKLG